MIAMRYSCVISWILLVFVHHVSAQQNVLEAYIREGLSNNLALQQKIIALEKSLEQEKEAKGKYYPDISFNARYSVAEGGRTIDFPVGDLLNPVYGTLNQLTGTGDFSMIDNEKFFFFRPREQETKIQLVQPVFNPAIHFNHRARSALIEMREWDAQAYRRFLVFEIKSAYYNYLKTEEIMALYDQTASLLEENIRVNESLYKNDKVTIDRVFRSRAELSKLDQQRAEARKFHHTARAYFNFLLDRDLETEIIVEEPAQFGPPVPGLQEAMDYARDRREELRSLRSYEHVTEIMAHLNRSGRLPRIFGAVDYGIQGIDYQLSPDDDFVLASLVFQWDLFAGLQQKSRIQQSNLDHDMAGHQLSESEKKIGLEVIEAYYDLVASEERIEANEEELRAARKAFQLIEKKYAEGQASLLEFIDARTTMTNAEQNLILTRYDHLIRISRLERVACLYPLEN